MKGCKWEFNESKKDKNMMKKQFMIQLPELEILIII
jgi:hypothetical protein